MKHPTVHNFYRYSLRFSELALDDFAVILWAGLVPGGRVMTVASLSGVSWLGCLSIHLLAQGVEGILQFLGQLSDM